MTGFFALQRGVSRQARPAGKTARRGTTTVEFALVCPLLFTFMFACLEFGRAHQVKNAVVHAAYEGCRRAIVPGATAAQAVAAAKSVLDAGLISGATFTVNPSNITNTTTTVSMTVAVPLAPNMWAAQWFTSGVTVSRTCTLTREKTN